MVQTRWQKFKAFVSGHETTVTRTLLAILIILVLVLSFRDTIQAWYFDTVVIRPEDRPGKSVEYRTDSNWLDCIYNCALQVDVKRPGTCARVCDGRYGK